MTCDYDAEQQLLPLAFAVVADEENVANGGWFMQWVRKEVVDHDKITVISYQHLGIRAIFESGFWMTGISRRDYSPLLHSTHCTKFI
jgi:hypothetical protein